MPRLTASDLPRLVEAIDQAGRNPNHPAVVADFDPVEPAFESGVDQELSPYSDEYFAQQVRLYEEIAGRRLDQGEGELHTDDTAVLLDKPNPLGIDDASHVAEHVRALSTMLSIAAPGHRPRVLDLGAGHGLSSEVFAFCGCDVHAIDIDPVLGELSRSRAAVRGYSITRQVLNFDDVATLEDCAYDAAFFFQSLHHCLRPWVLVAALKSKLRPGGVIGFTGEPIQSIWWKHWGLRLDKESLYVARKHGWFESGWSHAFIADCFERNGFGIRFFAAGHGGGQIGIASTDAVRLTAATERARSLGLDLANVAGQQPLMPADAEYHTQIGIRSTLLGAPAFRTLSPHAGGILCFGPYVTLPAGRYRLSILLHRSASTASVGSHVVLDVVSDIGARTHFREELSLSSTDGLTVIERNFELERECRSVEARVTVVGSDAWACSFPEIRAVPPSTSRVSPLRKARGLLGAFSGRGASSARKPPC